jgi:hypothetical protein
MAADGSPNAPGVRRRPRNPGSIPISSLIPPDVRALAERRATAREEHDWPTADRLRGEIEAAGWKVVDRGTAFRLESAHPDEIEVGGEIRYGRSDAVPSRFEEPARGLATVVVIAREDVPGARRAVAGLLASTPPEVDIVVVADGLAESAAADLLASFGGVDRVEFLGTSVELGQGAVLNIGLRRARAPIIVVVDASIEPEGDIVTPVVDPLDEPTVAIAGAFGLRSSDLRHFEEAPTGQAAAIEGYVMAFRRADAIARGPIDEGFRLYRNLDIWWSLVLRDEGEGRAPREARVVPGLPLRRHEHVAWSTVLPLDRDRLSKRNFYRILDRFRDRLDLASGA